MLSAPLIARSGLERLAVPARHGASEGEPGLVLALQEDIALATVIARKGAREALAARVRDVFALDLPTTPRCAAAGPVAFAWAGPGHWLARAEAAQGHAFEQRLRDELPGLASVTDQSDGRTIVRVGGSRAARVLAKGVMIDLHPRAFGPGDAAVTAIAHVGVQFWQVDTAPTYECVVLRSFAADFWHWLIDAGKEFGVVVVKR